jgi:hypothetical protein
VQDTPKTCDNPPDDALDTATIVCAWSDALFLWTHLLTRHKLFFDREYGDLAALRAVLAAEGAANRATPSTPAEERAFDDRARIPLTLRLPRTVATTIAEHLSWSRALPDLPPGMAYDIESAALFPSDLVAHAQRIGIEWQRQLYLDPQPS